MALRFGLLGCVEDVPADCLDCCMGSSWILVASYGSKSVGRPSKKLNTECSLYRSGSGLSKSVHIGNVYMPTRISLELLKLIHFLPSWPELALPSEQRKLSWMHCTPPVSQPLFQLWLHREILCHMVVFRAVSQPTVIVWDGADIFRFNCIGFECWRVP